MEIYTVTMLERMKRDANGFPDFGDERIVGYYGLKEMAFDSVTHNICDIREHLYSYALVEKIKEGVYQSAGRGSRWWFQYREEDRQFHEITEPGWLEHMGGFSIG